MVRLAVSWQNTSGLRGLLYRCGHCGERQVSAEGFVATEDEEPYENVASMRICVFCNRPTLVERDFDNLVAGDDGLPTGGLSPAPMPGVDVEHLPPPVHALYEETRRAMAANAPTASILLSRTVLMHAAVEAAKSLNENLAVGLPFDPYLDYLQEKHFITARMRNVMGDVKRLANEAVHDTQPRTMPEARLVLYFIQALLQNVFEQQGQMALFYTIVGPRDASNS